MSRDIDCRFDELVVVFVLFFSIELGLMVLGIGFEVMVGDGYEKMYE